MTKIRFENLPSTKTPINAENLNKLNNVVISLTEPTTGEEVWLQTGANLFNYGNYTFDKVVQGAYNFIDLGTFEPNTLYTIYNYNKNGLNPNYSYTYISLSADYSGIIFNNLAENDSVTINTDNNGKLYLGVSSLTISNFTETDWNNFMLNFKEAMFVKGQNVNLPYQPYVKKKIYIKNDNNIYDEFLNVERVNNLQNYSTEEQVIGTWLGKPLYRKVIEFKFDASAWNSEARWFDQSLNNFFPIDVDDMFLKLWYVKENKYTLPIMFTKVDGNENYGVSYNFMRNFARISLGEMEDYNNWLNYTQQLIVEYTKTTD